MSKNNVEYSAAYIPGLKNYKTILNELTLHSAIPGKIQCEFAGRNCFTIWKINKLLLSMKISRNKRIDALYLRTLGQTECS